MVGDVTTPTVSVCIYADVDSLLDGSARKYALHLCKRTKGQRRGEFNSVDILYFHSYSTTVLVIPTLSPVSHHRKWQAFLATLNAVQGETCKLKAIA